MTENEFNVVKDIIAMITQKRNNAEMWEMKASHNDEAIRYGAEAWTLEQVLRDINDILYIHKKHQRELDEQEEIDRIDDLEWHSQYGQEQDIASWEQGHGGE
jgi:hypothetical protein